MESINEYRLQAECDALARMIFQDVVDDHGSDYTAEDLRDYMIDDVHTAVDGHQWIIYTHYAHDICRTCNTDNGDAFLQDIGLPSDLDASNAYDRIATIIAFGEMEARVIDSIDALLTEMVEDAA